MNRTYYTNEVALLIGLRDVFSLDVEVGFWREKTQALIRLWRQSVTIEGKEVTPRIPLLRAAALDLILFL